MTNTAVVATGTSQYEGKGKTTGPGLGMTPEIAQIGNTVDTNAVMMTVLSIEGRIDRTARIVIDEMIDEMIEGVHDRREYRRADRHVVDKSDDKRDERRRDGQPPQKRHASILDSS